MLLGWQTPTLTTFEISVESCATTGVAARNEAEGGDDFQRGQQFAYYRVLSLMQQQAEAFGLDLQDLSLDGLDPGATSWRRSESRPLV